MNEKEPMNMTRQHVYDLMKQAGHGAAKALEIAIDYERGDEHAKQWVAAVKQPPTQGT